VREESALIDSILQHEPLSTADLVNTLLLYFAGLAVHPKGDATDDDKNGARYDLCKLALLRLSAEDPVGFTRVAQKIKEKLGYPIGDVRRDMELLSAAQKRADAGPGSPLGAQHARADSQATQLVALAAAAELWHTPEDDAYATIEVNGHQEH
jgi:hypothetical protein